MKCSAALLTGAAMHVVSPSLARCNVTALQIEPLTCWRLRNLPYVDPSEIERNFPGIWM